MERIKNQLSEYCDCVEFDDRDVTELVNIVSMATCWNTGNVRSTLDEDCENFLLDERHEVIDLPACMDCVYEFEPFYRPFDPATFTFTLIKIAGTEETATPITDFSYSTLDGKFRIDTGLPSCKCHCKKCGCDPEYKLLVTYAAGYEKIPDCYLPVFCNLLDVIHAKNKCDCPNDCACDTPASEEDIKYATGDVVTVQVETDLGKMISKIISEGMLGRMSLCKAPTEFWGVIV